MSLISVGKYCNKCTEHNQVIVLSEDLKYYVTNRNALVQNVWPDLSADQREIIIAWGSELPYFCPPCWDSLFPEEE